MIGKCKIGIEAKKGTMTMEERKDPFARTKFDELIPASGKGGRAAKGVLWVFLIFGFFNIQRALGCHNWGDYALVWAGLLVFWVLIDGFITVAGAAKFFQQGERLKKYLMARFTQLIRIEIAVLLLAVISYAVTYLF